MSRKVGIILTAIIAVIVGLWMWAGIIPKNSTQIGGSTSVDPLMQRLTNTYSKKPNSNTFIYSSSGSTGGVNNAKSGTYKIGFISRALDDSITTVKAGSAPEVPNLTDSNYLTFGGDIDTYFKESKSIATDSQMHAVQIATDAIILTYDAPDWFVKDFSPEFNIALDNNGVTEPWKKTIQGIYSGNYTWVNVAQDINKISNKDINDKIPGNANKKETITPFAREPGSGTRSSFDNMFGIADQSKPSKAFEFNSNGMMYNNFRQDTFGYMSLNYLNQIKGNSKLQVVAVNGKNPKTDENFLSDVDAKSYPLTRPYIGIIKAKLDDNDLSKIANFLAWIATAQAEAKDDSLANDGNTAYAQFKKAGLVPTFKLDSSDIPGYKSSESNDVKENTESSTLSAIKKTIAYGYVPRR